MLLIIFFRFLLTIPIVFFLGLVRIYNFILTKLDWKNYDTFFEEYLQKIIDRNLSAKINIDYNKHLRIYIPTKISAFRARTFFSKEPDTINWMLKNGKKNKILFDIGANIGIYSLYYAKKFNGKVFAFEPSIRNLDLLSRNIKLNKLNKNISIFSNPLIEKDKLGEFFQYDLRGGHSVAAFDSSAIKKKILIEHSHQKKQVSSFTTLGLSLDSFILKKILPCPDLIKIDVDGNELQILKGCKLLLLKKKKISILIEIQKKSEKTVFSFLKKLKFKCISQSNRNFIWNNY